MIERCQRRGTKVILSGLRDQPRRILGQMAVVEDAGSLRFARNFEEALAVARISEDSDT
jgi:sulfate permease, SulP family